MRFNTRTTSVETSPIALAHDALAHRRVDGPGLLDLSQAAPSYPPAPIVQTRLAAVATSGDGARYAPSRGLPQLREVFANELSVDYQATVTADNIQITAGANQAFCAVASALTMPGDNVVVPVPYYFNHRMWLELDGVVPRFVETDDSLLPSAEGVMAACDERTRALVLVTPGNPTGAIATPQHIAELAEVCRGAGIVLIIDETYRTFVPHQPPHGLFSSPDWDDHVISIHSFSKDLAIPGYRVGAIVASPALIDETLKILDCVAICAPRAGQEAVIAGLRGAQSWRRAKVERIGALQRAFEHTMASKPGGFELLSAGAFFGWVRHPMTATPATEVVRLLVAQLDILAIPGTAFTPTDTGCLRFSFANLDDPEIDELGQRLASFSAS